MPQHAGVPPGNAHCKGGIFQRIAAQEAQLQDAPVVLRQKSKHPAYPLHIPLQIILRYASQAYRLATRLERLSSSIASRLEVRVL